MYSIGEVARLTGISAFTLRYYEKIGLLPSPRRLDGKQDGVRRYDERDLRFIRFIHGLKQTGMKLEEIAAFTEDGCLMNHPDLEHVDKKGILHKRIEMLDKHMDWLQQQMKQLEYVNEIAKQKRAFYSAMLDEELSKDGNARIIEQKSR